jgi:hypothetical protein
MRLERELRLVAPARTGFGSRRAARRLSTVTEALVLALAPNDNGG